MASLIKAKKEQQGVVRDRIGVQDYYSQHRRSQSSATQRLAGRTVHVSSFGRMHAWTQKEYSYNRAAAN